MRKIIVVKSGNSFVSKYDIGVLSCDDGSTVPGFDISMNFRSKSGTSYITLPGKGDGERRSITVDLTPEMEAVAMTRIQWQYVAAEAPHDLKVKEKWGKRTGVAKGASYCHLCEYAGAPSSRDCKKCPLNGIAWNEILYGDAFCLDSTGSVYKAWRNAESDHDRQTQALRMVEACERKLDQLFEKALNPTPSKKQCIDLGNFITEDRGLGEQHVGCHPVIAETLRRGKKILCRVSDFADRWEDELLVYEYDKTDDYSYQTEGGEGHYRYAEPIPKQEKEKETIRVIKPYKFILEWLKDNDLDSLQLPEMLKLAGRIDDGEYDWPDALVEVRRIPKEGETIWVSDQEPEDYSDMNEQEIGVGGQFHCFIDGIAHVSPVTPWKYWRFLDAD